jgi:hypothetical protein
MPLGEYAQHVAWLPFAASSPGCTTCKAWQGLQGASRRSKDSTTPPLPAQLSTGILGFMAS